MLSTSLTMGAIAAYSFCLTTLILLAGLIVSVRQYMWLCYCGQSFAFLLYFSALDGHLAILFGLSPAATPVLAGITGGIACATGFAICGLLLRPEHKLRRYTPVLIALSFVALFSPLLLLTVEAATFHQGLALLFWLMIAAQVLPPITWFFLPAWARNAVMPFTVFVVFCIAVSGLLSTTGGPLVPGTPSALRWGIILWCVAVGAVTMLAMTGIIQRVRIKNADRALQAVQGELAAVRSAQQAERDMQRARELATLRGEQLASAAHDIRQPLMALRSSVRHLAASAQGAPAELSDAIDYVESLATSYLQLADDETSSAHPDPGENPIETIDAQLILSSMLAMFASDAESVGIEMTVVPTSLQVRAPPLVLMRIAANCVTNAIKHSRGTAVLVGWRRRRNTAELWIADDGQGLPPTVAASAFTASTRSRTSNGNGLGLAIVRQLAAEQGWTAKLDSRPGHGTTLRICGLTRVAAGATKLHI